MCLSNVIRDVNQLNDAGFIEVEGTRCKLEFFLGGDYKVGILIKNSQTDHSLVLLNLH